MLQQVMGWNWSLILGVALALSEALSLIPAVKANGIVQGIVGVIKFLAEKVAPKKE